MSVAGLKDAEKIQTSLEAKYKASLLQQKKAIKQEIDKLEYILSDKEALKAWKTSQAGLNRIASLSAQLDEIEALYLEAGDTTAGRIFKQRMQKELSQKLTNLKANEKEVEIQLEKLKASTKTQTLEKMSQIRQEGSLKEMYQESRKTGGFLSNFGRAYLQDIVTLDTKAAGSKTLGEYMQNLYNTYEKGLKDVFVKGIIRGDSYSTMIKNLQKQTDITAGKANLLVRTEANAIFNDSVKKVIQDNPLVKGYRFRAVLDRRTSKLCQEHDGEFIPKDDIQPGINYPPLHPNCRSTVTTVLVDEDEKRDTMQRYTKNGSNEWTAVPVGMTYKEFKEKMYELQNPFRKVPTTATLKTYNISQLSEQVTNAERSIIKSPVERAVIFTNDGNKIELKGTAFSVDTTQVGEDMLRDAVITHNHPNMVQGPSLQDLQEYERAHYRQLRTVDNKYSYILELTGAPETLEADYKAAEMKVKQALFEGSLKLDDEEATYQRLTMKQLAKDHPEYLKFSYKEHNYKK